ncbi:hypothetical protein CPB85DRAFT_1292377 [Mucidula mucida]|nr:hypothetical protein CPB85DRAFT_1292377 [Mucidula mucida]
MSVIYYRYDASPFARKLEHILYIKQIPHHTVNVKSFLPRPEITDFLGLGYRRIPILAIGNDIYCDTSLIASTLERRFPISQGYGTLFPPRKGGGSDASAIKIYAKHYTDSVLFPLGPVFLQWEKFPEVFLQDRAAFSNVPSISAASMINVRGKNLSLIASHIALSEEQLGDGREWLFDTTSPSLADVSLHFILSWIKAAPGTESVFDEKKAPRTLKWLSRTTEYLSNLKSTLSVTKITGDEAAKRIASGTHEDYFVVGFDLVEAMRLGLKDGEIVQVTPDDTGRAFPTTGRLIGLSQEEYVLETTSSFGVFKCHFPRIGFTVRVLTESKSKL